MNQELINLCVSLINLGCEITHEEEDFILLHKDGYNIKVEKSDD